jgi:hypothetical protein
MKMKFVRISRHELSIQGQEWLEHKFPGIEIVTQDIPYGDNPVAAVTTLLNSFDPTEVVAVELGAPIAVLARLLAAKRDIPVPLVRQRFARDGEGRVLVSGQDESGRDILVFDGYDVYEEAVVKTYPF